MVKTMQKDLIEEYLEMRKKTNEDKSKNPHTLTRPVERPLLEWLMK
jgi:hypothetical protein